MLEGEGALNGSEIAKRLGRDVSNTHKVLKELTGDGLLTSKRDGREVLYELSRED